MSERMNPEVKAKWLTALRSDDYTQAVGVLHKEDGGRCCLGVLCDVAIKSGLDLAIGDDCAGNTSYDGEAGYLPIRVQEWAGLGAKNPRISGNGLENSLAMHNDNGRSFAEIADLIEEHL